jgi:hypothetical protein
MSNCPEHKRDFAIRLPFKGMVQADDLSPAVARAKVQLARRIFHDEACDAVDP